MPNNSANSLNFSYEKALSSTIPAVRLAVAMSLKKKGMSETMIAKSVGIAQAAVSKYLSGNYSPKIGKLARFIESKGLHKQIIKAIIAKKGQEEILKLIDKTAAGRQLMAVALK